MSIQTSLPHQLCHPSIHTTLRLIYETSKRTVRYMLKAIAKDTISFSLNDFGQDHFTV